MELNKPNQKKLTAHASPLRTTTQCCRTSPTYPRHAALHAHVSIVNTQLPLTGFTIHAITATLANGNKARGCVPLEFAALRVPHPPEQARQRHTITRHHHINTATYPFRPRRQQYTPRTSRATVAVSAASTSRHRCSADCHNTDIATTTTNASQARLAAYVSYCGHAVTVPAPLVSPPAKQPRADNTNAQPTPNNRQKCRLRYLESDHVRQCRLVAVPCTLF